MKLSSYNERDLLKLIKDQLEFDKIFDERNIYKSCNSVYGK